MIIQKSTHKRKNFQLETCITATDSEHINNTIQKKLDL